MKATTATDVTATTRTNATSTLTLPMNVSSRLATFRDSSPGTSMEAVPSLLLVSKIVPVSCVVYIVPLPIDSPTEIESDSMALLDAVLSSFILVWFVMQLLLFCPKQDSVGFPDATQNDVECNPGYVIY
jgi:hypothetical protein